MVLDLGLPDIDGAEMLRMLRAVNDVPVIVATARDAEAEVVRLPAGGCWTGPGRAWLASLELPAVSHELWNAAG